MNASFGIDHPLLATHDIEALREHLNSLGFNMTTIGKHPWGTSTSLAMFDGCLLEIMGIYDDTLLDKVPARNFRFERHVYEHLQVREGVALSVLHSTDSVKDAEHAQQVGLTVSRSFGVWARCHPSQRYARAHQNNTHTDARRQIPTLVLLLVPTTSSRANLCT